MANLYFYYSTMNAGKTTLLLQNKYNYDSKFVTSLLFVSAISNNRGIVYSRIGLKKKAIVIYNNLNIFKYIKTLYNRPKLILIDEVQFLTKKQIFELIGIVDILDINILTYGLRTDFKSELFIASKYLLALADKIIEIKSFCKCGKKSIMNARFDLDRKIIIGKQVEINKNKYLSLCRYHYYNFNL